MNVISKHEALAQQLPRYFTGIPCKYGHLSERYSCNARCVLCQLITLRELRETKPTKAIEYRLRYKAKEHDRYLANRNEVIRKTSAYATARRPRLNELKRLAYRERNGDIVRARNRDWNAKNKERARSYSRNWSTNNVGLVNAARKAYQAAKLQRIPGWAELAAIREIYKEASALTKTTGIPYHVDHIYPLQGKLCSGLHVLANLQIITALENAHKGHQHPEKVPHLVRSVL